MVEKKYNFEDEQSVADLLGSLPRVEAPGNFDIGVRSRIANGRPSSRSAWLIPSAAAVSLCSMVLAAVAFIYLGGSEPQVADATQPSSAPRVAPEKSQPEFTAVVDPEPANMNPRVTDSSPPETGGASNVRPRPTVPPRGGGSYDTAVKPSADPIVPKGIPTPGSTPNINIKPPTTDVKVPAREILQLIGLDAEFGDAGWRVQRVTDNSAAAKSEIRVGDVVEAIDDTKVVGDTTFESGFSGKSLTVVRDGVRQTIRLRN
jgi:membrane-associated protease RseP (regulator of RpoE activity)